MSQQKLIDVSGGQYIPAVCIVDVDGSSHSGVAGDTTITLGGTAQTLFSGTTPTNGWAVFSKDTSLFKSDLLTGISEILHVI